MITFQEIYDRRIVGDKNVFRMAERLVLRGEGQKSPCRTDETLASSDKDSDFIKKICPHCHKQYIVSSFIDCSGFRIFEAKHP